MKIYTQCKIKNSKRKVWLDQYGEPPNPYDLSNRDNVKFITNENYTNR